MQRLKENYFKTHQDMWRHIFAEVDRLHDNLVEVEVRKPCDRLMHVQFEALGMLQSR